MQINSLGKVDNSVLTRSASPEQVKPTATSSNKVAPQSSSSASTVAASVKISSTAVEGEKSSTVSTQAQVSALEASFSATVGGKNYPESIAESAGVYVASVPNPPGQTATGATIESAEYNLQVKLDTLA